MSSRCNPESQMAMHVTIFFFLLCTHKEQGCVFQYWLYCKTNREGTNYVHFLLLFSKKNFNSVTTLTAKDVTETSPAY